MVGGSSIFGEHVPIERNEEDTPHLDTQQPKQQDEWIGMGIGAEFGMRIRIKDKGRATHSTTILPIPTFPSHPIPRPWHSKHRWSIHFHRDYGQFRFRTEL